MSTQRFNFSLPQNKLPRHVREWTLDEVRKLRELAQQGCTLADIARELRRSMGAVYSRSLKHGIAVVTSEPMRKRRR